MLRLETLLEQSNELPSLPEIYTRVSELLEAENSSAQQIGEAVQTDPSLTTKILKMVNSAYFGLPNHVNSIPQAVTLLGRQQLKQTLMGSVLAGIFSEINSVKFDMREFWQHSIKTAIIAKNLAMQNANIIDHEAFFTAGLIHDIGRLVIAKVAPEALAEIDVLVKNEGVDVIVAETEKLGITHIDAGAAVMKKWSMPSFLSQCVLKHHEVEHVGPFAIDTSIVYLANHLSKHQLVADEEDLRSILADISSWQQTQCTLHQIFVACELADQQWYEVMESLGMVDMEINDELY